MKSKPTLAQMALADKRDEAAIKAILSGQELDPLYLWHAPGIPTFANALQLSKEYGITKVSSEVNQTSNGDFVAVVWLENTGTQSIRAGAGRHRDPMVARGYAFRNSVRQLLVEVM